MKLMRGEAEDLRSKAAYAEEAEKTAREAAERTLASRQQQLSGAGCMGTLSRLEPERLG